MQFGLGLMRVGLRLGLALGLLVLASSTSGLINNPGNKATVSVYLEQSFYYYYNYKNRTRSTQ